MCQEEDSEVAVQGVGMLPEGTGVEGLGGVHLHLTPTHQARFQQQGMRSRQDLHLCQVQHLQ